MSQCARAAVGGLIIAVVLLACGAASALVVHSDLRWRESTGGREGLNCPDGWMTPELDDSAWPPVTYPYLLLWPRDWPPDPAARAFWGSWTKGCVRRHFRLAERPQQPAVIHVWVDDDYELYVNGTQVGFSRDGWAQMPGETYDVTALLKAGDNVIAMFVTDCTGEGRGVLFSLDVPGAPDESITFAEVVNTARPYVTFAAVIVAAALFMLAVARLRRWAAPRLQRWPGGVLASAVVVLVVLAQWLLHTQLLYILFPGNAIAEWQWGELAVTGITVALLVVAFGGVQDDAAPTASQSRHWLVFVAILFLALALRAVALDSVPPGFFQDEAMNGFDALQLFKRNSIEIWSDELGGRPTLFLYVLGASLRFFGISYLHLKIVPVIIAVASVASLYLLGRIALGPSAALWGAALFAVSQWHITFSRIAWEVGLVPLFSSLGCALLLYGLEDRRWARLALVASGGVLAMGLYTYAAYRAVPAAVLVFLVATAVSGDRATVWRRLVPLLGAGVVAVIVILPLALFAWHNPVRYWARYSDLSLTNYMTYYSTPVPWLHQFGKAVLALAHRDERSTVFEPFLDVVSGAFFLVGLVAPPPEGRRRGLRVLWAWFLTFAALSCLTKDSPHATRMLGMLPPVALLAGYGATRLLGALRRLPAGGRAAPALATLLFLYAAGANAYQYFFMQQQVPLIDDLMNVRARELCEWLHERQGVRAYWTDDVAYWCKAQCAFLEGADWMKTPTIIGDLTDTHVLRDGPRPVIVIVGISFLDEHHNMPRDPNGDPILDLPARPVVHLNRSAKKMYYVYEF